MLTIELVYNLSCPNLTAARDILKQALAQAGVAETWDEIDITSGDCPDYAKKSGSPSIFINGKDVSTSHLKGEKACCRSYRGDTGNTSVAPTVEMIVNAITNA